MIKAYVVSAPRESGEDEVFGYFTDVNVAEVAAKTNTPSDALMFNVTDISIDDPALIEFVLRKSKVIKLLEDSNMAYSKSIQKRIAVQLAQPLEKPLQLPTDLTGE